MNVGPVQPAPRRVDNKWLVTISITFGTLMGAIDASIVNVALPHIRGSVGATVDEITWISTSYMIATVIVMPMTGFLGRRFGQKQVYMACLMLFLAGSALCGLARTLPVLVFFRVLQGLGAGALQPTEQAILRQTFPPEEQGMAMALFSMAVMIGPAVGPTLGGWITDNIGWPWIFYINLPVGVVGLLMVWRFVHEPEDIRRVSRERAELERRHMDWAGIGFMIIGLGALMYVLEEGARNDWFDSTKVSVLVFVAAVALVAFVIRELTATAPVVNIRLFKDKTYASGTIIGAVMFAMLMGSMYLLPVFMQEVLGYTATDSGLALMPRTLVMMAITPIVGRLYNKVHPAVSVAIGVVLFSVSCYQLSHVTLGAGMKDIIAPLLITGVAFSFLFVPLTTVALSGIQRHQLADASGLNALFRMAGGSIGLALFATALPKFFAQAHAGVAAHVSALSPEAVQRLAQLQATLHGKGYDGHTAQLLAYKIMGGTVAQQATVMSFEKAFLVQGLLFLLVLPLLFFLKVDRKKLSKPSLAHAAAE